MPSSTLCVGGAGTGRGSVQHGIPTLSVGTRRNLQPGEGFLPEYLVDLRNCVLDEDLAKIALT